MKTLCADGSVPFGHARVGHCQDLKFDGDVVAARHRLYGSREAPAGYLLGLFAFATGADWGGGMNTLERRKLVRAHVIDVAIAKAAINKSRRQRAAATKSLVKELSASRAASRSAETISYPQAS